MTNMDLMALMQALVAKEALVALMVAQVSEDLKISSQASLVVVLLAIQMLLVKEMTFSIVST